MNELVIAGSSLMRKLNKEVHKVLLSAKPLAIEEIDYTPICAPRMITRKIGESFESRLERSRFMRLAAKEIVFNSDAENCIIPEYEFLQSVKDESCNEWNSIILKMYNHTRDRSWNWPAGDHRLGGEREQPMRINTYAGINIATLLERLGFIPVSLKVPTKPNFTSEFEIKAELNEDIFVRVRISDGDLIQGHLSIKENDHHFGSRFTSYIRRPYIPEMISPIAFNLMLHLTGYYSKEEELKLNLLLEQQLKYL